MSASTKELAIEVLLTPECPHAAATVELVRDVAARLAPGAEVRVTTVRSPEEAVALSFPGSPTVRVNGGDLEGASPGPAAFACRRYADGSGVPPRWLVEAGVLGALNPRHVLFLCVANSARSQMAEGLGRSLAPAGMRISSAGSEPSSVRPQAVAALADIGIDASAQHSKSFDEFLEGGSEFDASAPVDCVITLCAEENCPLWLGDARRVHWPLADPAAATGTEEKVMDSFRSVRDEIARRLEAVFRP